MRALRALHIYDSMPGGAENILSAYQQISYKDLTMKERNVVVDRITDVISSPDVIKQVFGTAAIITHYLPGDLETIRENMKNAFSDPSLADVSFLRFDLLASENDDLSDALVYDKPLLLLHLTRLWNAYSMTDIRESFFRKLGVQPARVPIVIKKRLISGMDRSGQYQINSKIIEADLYSGEQLIVHEVAHATQYGGRDVGGFGHKRLEVLMSEGGAIFWELLYKRWLIRNTTDDPAGYLGSELAKIAAGYKLSIGWDFATRMNLLEIYSATRPFSAEAVDTALAHKFDSSIDAKYSLGVAFSILVYAVNGYDIAKTAQDMADMHRLDFAMLRIAESARTDPENRLVDRICDKFKVK